MTATTVDFPVSRIGLGCVTFGREIDADRSFEIMDYAFAHGINFFDTAASYGDGASERIIGRWLRTRGLGKHITIETKVSGDFRRGNVRDSLDGSLERLMLDRVDAYLLHSFDPMVPLQESLEALTLTVESRKARLVGCSNFSAGQLAGALDLSERHGLARFRVVQPIYNLAARAIEKELVPLACARDVALVTYSPLGAGFLTGKYTPNRAAIPAGTRFHVKPGHADIYFKPENFQIVERLQRLSDATGFSMARLAVSWVLENQHLTSVLVGGRSPEHIANALAALRNPLPAEWKAAMDAWSFSEIPPP